MLKMEILQNKKNNLMHREEIIVTLHSDITPSKIQIIERISEQMKKSPENIVVEKIQGSYGTRNVKVYAKVYDDLISKQKFEVVSRKTRKKSAEEAKKSAEAVKVEAAGVA